MPTKYTKNGITYQYYDEVEVHGWERAQEKTRLKATYQVIKTEESFMGPVIQHAFFNCTAKRHGDKWYSTIRHPGSTTCPTCLNTLNNMNGEDCPACQGDFITQGEIDNDCCWFCRGPIPERKKHGKG